MSLHSRGEVDIGNSILIEFLNWYRSRVDVRISLDLFRKRGGNITLGIQKSRAAFSKRAGPLWSVSCPLLPTCGSRSRYGTVHPDQVIMGGRVNGEVEARNAIMIAEWTQDVKRLQPRKTDF